MRSEECRGGWTFAAGEVPAPSRQILHKATKPTVGEGGHSPEAKSSRPPVKFRTNLKAGLRALPSNSAQTSKRASAPSRRTPHHP